MRWFIYPILIGVFLAGATQLRAHAATATNPINICVQLHNHVSLAQIEDQLETAGFTAAAAGRYTGEIVKAQCPDMTAAIIGQLA